MPAMMYHVDLELEDGTEITLDILGDNEDQARADAMYLIERSLEIKESLLEAGQ